MSRDVSGKKVVVVETPNSNRYLDQWGVAQVEDVDIFLENDIVHEIDIVHEVDIFGRSCLLDDVLAASSESHNNPALNPAMSVVDRKSMKPQEVSFDAELGVVYAV
jgi:hypothetical protein